MTRFVLSLPPAPSPARSIAAKLARRVVATALAASSALAASACSTESTPAAPAAPLSESYRRLGDKLGQTLALVKSSATTAGALAPAELGEVAPIPVSVTGGTDITTSQDGKTGERAADVDALGEEESVRVFVPDPPSGGGTAATLPSFAAWRGDAESGDAGLCYLAWTKGASWFVASTCGDASGAFVCQVTSADVTCDACNTAGECTACDMTRPTFECAWP